MSDVEKEIAAVKFLLGSFFDDPSEVERKKLIKKEVLTNSHVKTYARFSEEELKLQLGISRVSSVVSDGAHRLVFLLMSFCQFT